MSERLKWDVQQVRFVGEYVFAQVALEVAPKSGDGPILTARFRLPLKRAGDSLQAIRERSIKLLKAALKEDALLSALDND